MNWNYSTLRDRGNRKEEVYFHSDIVQGSKKIPLNVKELNVDLLSV